MCIYFWKRTLHNISLLMKGKIGCAKVVSEIKIFSSSLETENYSKKKNKHNFISHKSWCNVIFVSSTLAFIFLHICFAFCYHTASHLTCIKDEHLNPLMTNVPHHIETSQLIWIANQLTGFYMMGNIGHW